jgi:hypothetical protein
MGEYEGNEHLGDLDADRRIILKWTLRNRLVE